MTALLFQEPDLSRAVRSRRARREDSDTTQKQGESRDENSASEKDPRDHTDANAEESSGRKRRRGKRGGRKSSDDGHQDSTENADEQAQEESESASRNQRTRKRQRKVSSDSADQNTDNAKTSEDSNNADDQNEAQTSTVRRRRRRSSEETDDGVTAPKGSTRLEAKRRRRKEGRRNSRRHTTISESEYLARREAVDRTMLVREQDGLNQIAVLEDSVLVEHYVARHTQTSMVGNVYLGRVQNVLPSMEAAFVDIGKGRNAVLYAGEVNWDAVGLNSSPRKIENALKSGDTVLVQVTKDPIGHKGARLTGQVTLAGRHLVLVPNGSMTGISRKLPDKERSRLKSILKKVVPSEHGVIVRTAAEGATEEQLQGDVNRLLKSWKDIEAKSKSTKNAPSILKAEPELAVRVVRDIFNEDFKELKVSGDDAWATISSYVEELSPELVDRLEHWTGDQDIFEASRVDEQLAKAFDRKVFLPSGGSLIIERTEAMTVIDVNTGKFTGSGGTLEETVTRNNLEAAEEVVRQLRLRDIGGIIVIDFIDMVLEENRDLVLRRLIECLGRDRTRHQVAEVTSLGLVQMTRKRVGQGLVEAFSTTCECCDGHGYITHANPVERGETDEQNPRTNVRRQTKQCAKGSPAHNELDPKHEEVRAALANIAAAASSKHESEKSTEEPEAKNAEPEAKNAEPQAKPEEARDQANESHAKPQRKRRVTSSGTITTGNSPKSHIMTFPAKSNEQGAE
nr:Rne/Rng family ribonuclease [Trueperella bonasi]